MDFCAELLPNSGILLTMGGLILATAVFISRYFRQNYLNKFPLVGEELGGYSTRERLYVSNARRLYTEGYQKFRNAVFRITTSDGEKIVLPPKYLDELRCRTDEEVNSTKALNLLVESDYTKFGIESDFVNHMVRVDLMSNTVRITPRLLAEVERTVPTELGPCDEWTEVAIYQTMLRIVAIVSGNIFIGPELCRREEYLHAATNFTVAVFSASRCLKSKPLLYRPFSRWFIPELRDVEDHRRKATAFLGPIVRERKRIKKSGEQVPDDMLQWMIDEGEKLGMDEHEIACSQLTLTVVAIHTTAMAATHVLYDLIMHPQVLNDLRKEIYEVLGEHNNVINSSSLFQMKLLDSVMRESQRLNPTNMARFTRFVEKPLILSDGTYIPAGVFIEIPYIAIIEDESNFTDAKTFNGYRFYDLRTTNKSSSLHKKSKEQYQFISVTSKNMGFGFGRRACPGRFFAAMEIKMTLARLLLDYDLKPPEGVVERYPNIIVGATVSIDPNRTIMLRNRKRC